MRVWNHIFWWFAGQPNHFFELFFITYFKLLFYYIFHAIFPSHLAYSEASTYTCISFEGSPTILFTCTSVHIFSCTSAYIFFVLALTYFLYSRSHIYFAALTTVRAYMFISQLAMQCLLLRFARAHHSCIGVNARDRSPLRALTVHVSVCCVCSLNALICHFAGIFNTCIAQRLFLLSILGPVPADSFTTNTIQINPEISIIFLWT